LSQFYRFKNERDKELEQRRQELTLQRRQNENLCKNLPIYFQQPENNSPKPHYDTVDKSRINNFVVDTSSDYHVTSQDDNLSSTECRSTTNVRQKLALFEQEAQRLNQQESSTKLLSSPTKCRAPTKPTTTIAEPIYIPKPDYDEEKIDAREKNPRLERRWCRDKEVEENCRRRQNVDDDDNWHQQHQKKGNLAPKYVGQNAFGHLSNGNKFFC